MHDSKLEDAAAAAAPQPLPAAERAFAIVPAETPAAPVDAAAAEPAANTAIDAPPDAPATDPTPPRAPTLAPDPDDGPPRTRQSETWAEQIEVKAEPSDTPAEPSEVADTNIIPAAVAAAPRLREGCGGEGEPPAPPPSAATPLFTEAVDARAPPQPTRPTWWPPRLPAWTPTLAQLARFAGLALASWLALVVLLVALFRVVDPPGSMLMLLERLGGTTITMRWRDLDDISPELVRAVVASEDARVCEHWGIDLDEIANAIRRSRDGTPRGASTISMQVAKNLFLWPSKSYLRKLLEVPVTLAIELLWPKRRIVEVYLNIAEWGPGVFGAEAAARHHFAKPAKRLSARESALLAVSLPNPALRSASKPSRLVSHLAGLIERRAKALGSATRCLAP